MREFKQLIEAIRSVKEGKFEPIRLPSNDRNTEWVEAVNEMLSMVDQRLKEAETRSDEQVFTLYTLNYAAKIIGSTLNLKELLDIALETFIDIGKVRGGSIELLDRQGRLKTKVKENIPEIDRKLIKGVIRESEPYAGKIKGKSLLCLPLMGKEKPIGVVSLYDGVDKQEFSHEDVNIISTLTTQVGVSIENAQLYEELDRWNKQLERKVADRTKELKEANEELKKLDKAKSDFLSMVSHELRTPLTSIKAFTEMLLKNPDREVGTRIKYLGIMQGECNRLTRLINNVLDLSKIEAGKVEWNIRPISITEVVNISLTSTHKVIEDKGIEAVALIEDGLPSVLADKDRLIQVIINLVGNAVKFTEKGGRIEVRVKKNLRPAECIHVSVSDTGIGIRKKDLGKVFQRFKQVGNGMTDRPEGTGLGLSISREIIEHHKGRIWVESKLKKGTTFHFTLPIGGEEVCWKG
ncbi:MAG: GAF domain-containing sensor histidine kinase [Nitrospirae bacterium]|nr:GAF domain-containing sensor histidine kinase [Nitrospirota bacterium]